MKTAIRKHLRDFLAVAGMIAVALGVTYVLLQKQRLRIPVLEEKPFELRAEFETAQAITAGQGQSVNVAGVKIGDISKIELEDGIAVVSMDVERKYLPIYEDATALVRPRTGLQDMFIELDPGSRSAGEIEDGGTIPLANTQPAVNLDRVLAALDNDTQAYLRLLLVGAGQGLKGRSQDLGKLLGSLGPINRKLARLSSEIATRRQNLSNVIHNLNVLTRTIGEHDSELAELVVTSNAALGAIAEQDPNVQRAVALLPGTLQTANTALGKVRGLADQLGPTFRDLIPFAQNLDRLNASLIDVASTTPIIRDQIRPLVRAAREPVRDLEPTARRLAKATPRLTDIGLEINRLGNMVAYNPRGAEPVGTPGRDEGYLFSLAWVTHNGNSAFSAQDAHGLYRRIYFTTSCGNLADILQQTPLAPVITPFAQLFVGSGACN
jgi:phospholipid/cholesterol/gamma-HCH transport system substrate-binding protein